MAEPFQQKGEEQGKQIEGSEFARLCWEEGRVTAVGSCAIDPSP